MTESFKWFYIVILFSAPNSNTRRYLIIGSGLGIRTPNSCSMNAKRNNCCLGICQCHAYKRVIPFHQSAIYLAGEQGFEPQYTVLETVVLPLNDTPI